MPDNMNIEQYRKACRYRVQETLENLVAAWQVPDEQINSELIVVSLQWLEGMVADLRYFQERIAGASAGPFGSGLVSEK